VWCGQAAPRLGGPEVSTVSRPCPMASPCSPQWVARGSRHTVRFFFLAFVIRARVSTVSAWCSRVVGLQRCQVKSSLGSSTFFCMICIEVCLYDRVMTKTVCLLKPCQWCGPLLVHTTETLRMCVLAHLCLAFFCVLPRSLQQVRTSTGQGSLPSTAIRNSTCSPRTFRFRFRLARLDQVWPTSLRQSLARQCSQGESVSGGVLVCALAWLFNSWFIHG